MHENEFGLTGIQAVILSQPSTRREGQRVSIANVAGHAMPARAIFAKLLPADLKASGSDSSFIY